MSWKATAYVKPLKRSPDGTPLTRSEKFLLFILADYHNDEQRAAWPSGATLARDALMTLRHVRSLLAGLKAKGILCTSPRVSPKGDFDTTIYHFHAIDCDGPHEVPVEEEPAPPEDGGAPARGGSEMISLPPPSGVVLPTTLGSELATSLPSVVGNTGVVLPTALPVVKNGGSHNKDEPPVVTASEPPHKPPPTHSRSAAPAPPEPPLLKLAEGVSVSKSNFTLEERRAFANNQQPKLGGGWLYLSADGRYDEVIQLWLDEQRAAVAGKRERDVSGCAQCQGTGWWYPQGVERGAARCKHPGLANGAAEARAGPPG